MGRLIRALVIAAAMATADHLRAAEDLLPDTFELPRMKASIFVGSVTLITSPFTYAEEEAAYVATYEARVSPWAFFSEAGTINLPITLEDYARLRQGEAIELTGEAENDDGKRRRISVQARPTDAESGTIKVNVTASGLQLVFKGRYEMVAAPADAS